MDKLYFEKILKELLAIRSPLGYHEEIIPYIKRLISEFGYEVKEFNRGGLSVTVGEGEHVAITAHLDEIGLSVRGIKENGRLTLCPIGGIYAKTLNESDAEVVTLSGTKFTGTVRHVNPSVHMAQNSEYDEKLDLYKNMEFVLDELVYSKSDVMDLGINCGDYVLLDSRTKITNSGFIKSRFIDDKINAALLICAIKEIHEKNIKLNKKITFHFSVYEENGTGGATGLDYDISEMIALDIGCLAAGSDAKETSVSIIAQDSRSPYSREIIKLLKKLAEENDINYTIDVNYPHYGSDTHPAINAGHDIKFGLFGPGIFASHGYERTHMDGVVNTYNLLMAYIKK